MTRLAWDEDYLQKVTTDFLEVIELRDRYDRKDGDTYIIEDHYGDTLRLNPDTVKITRKSDEDHNAHLKLKRYIDSDAHVILGITPENWQELGPERRFETLCHEAAHIKHYNHNPEFWEAHAAGLINALDDIDGINQWFLRQGRHGYSKRLIYSKCLLSIKESSINKKETTVRRQKEQVMTMFENWEQHRVKP